MVPEEWLLSEGLKTLASLGVFFIHVLGCLWDLYWFMYRVTGFPPPALNLWLPEAFSWFSLAFQIERD